MSNIPKVIIYQSELDFISRCVMDYPDLETGGDFFGFWTKKGNPVIQYVIGPGKSSTRTETSFFQEIDYLKRCGTVLNSKYGLEHIGGWHSHHHLGLSQPSSGDVNTMRNALRDQDLPRFIISICNIDENSSVSVKGFLFSQGNPNDYSQCSWNVLDSYSPIRDNLERENINVFILPDFSTQAQTIRTIDFNEDGEKKSRIEKPDLSENSYWNKPEGRLYLKNVYEKLKKRRDLSNVEILQLADRRIALSFNHCGRGYEIRFPEDFPGTDPEVVEKTMITDEKILPATLKKMFKYKKKELNLQEFIYSLDILGRDISFVIKRI